MRTRALHIMEMKSLMMTLIGITRSVAFLLGYVPTKDEIKGLELLNEKFEIDKEQATKF